jgi:hypothetical protein
MAWTYLISISKDWTKDKADLVARYGKDAKNDPKVPWAGDSTPAAKIGDKSAVLIAVKDEAEVKKTPGLVLHKTRAAAEADEPDLCADLGVLFGVLV